MTPSPGRRPLLVAGAVGLVLVQWLVLFDGALLGGETFFARDLTPFFKPLLRLAVRLWHESAGLPLWNPYVSWGQPWLANPNAAPLHPLTLLALLVGERAALVANVTLPPLLAVAAMFFLLRTRSSRPATALFGGLVWGFGGYLLSTANLIAALRTAAVMPAALAFAIRVARRGRGIDAVGLAVTTGVVLAGLEPTLLLAFLALLVVTLVETLPSGPPTTRARAQRVGLVALGLAFGVATSAAVVLPAVRLAPRTQRATPLPAAEWASYSLAPPRLLEPVSPRLLGPVDFRSPERYWGSAWYGDKQLPLLASVYGGLLTVALAAAGLVHGDRRLRLWALLGGGGLLLALSGRLPAWLAALFRVPPFGQLRYTEKWVVLPILAAVLLAAFALDRVFDGDRRVRRTVNIGLAVVAGLALLLAGCLAAAPASATVRGALGIASDAGARAAAATAPLEAGLAVGLAVAYALAVGLSRRSPRGGAALLLALTSLDLVRIGRPLLPTAPPEWADAPPEILEPLLRRNPPPRLYHLAEWQPGCAGLSGAGWPPEPAGYGIPLAFTRDFDITQLAWTSRAAGSFRALTSAAPDLLLPGLSRRGVGALVSCVAGASPDLHGPGLALRLLGDVRPDVFCADRSLVADGAAGWRDAARHVGSAAPATAILDAGSIPAGLEIPARPSPCSVRIVASRPGSIAAAVAVAGPGPALLAVNQTWDDHWRVEVDGRTTPLLRAELCLSAVLLPPGRHDLILRYRDPVSIASAWISLAALLTLGLAGLYCRVRRTPNGPGRPGSRGLHSDDRY